MSDRKHAEAFALMWYACRMCHAADRVWNSRDGVTPFGMRCSSCGDSTMTHIIGRDEYAPNHRLLPFQRFWRDGTPEEAALIMRERIHLSKGTEYEVTDQRAADLIEMARTGKSHEFQQGWPMLDVELPTESLEAGTRRATITAMRRFKNDTSQVAEALGVSRKTVYNYLHKWGLKS
jgi:hypothetical protein